MARALCSLLFACLPFLPSFLVVYRVFVVVHCGGCVVALFNVCTGSREETDRWKYRTGWLGATNTLIMACRTLPQVIRSHTLPLYFVTGCVMNVLRNQIDTLRIVRCAAITYFLRARKEKLRTKFNDR
jgi:hypothetical protein